MTLTLIRALAIASGGLASLGSVLIVLMLLNSKRGPRAAVGYVAGYAGSYLIMGLASLSLGARTPTSPEAEGPSLVRACAFVILGLILLLAALRSWRKPADGEPPALFAKIDNSSPLRALGFGVLVTILNVKNSFIYLLAVSVIVQASLPPLHAVASIVLIVLVFCGGTLVPLAIVALFPKRSARWLARLREWVEANARRVALIILPLFGTARAARGVHELLQALAEL